MGFSTSSLLGGLAFGGKPNRPAEGDIAAAQQIKDAARTKGERISLLSEQLGNETRIRVAKYGTRPLLAGIGGSGNPQPQAAGNRFQGQALPGIGALLMSLLAQR